MYPDGIPKGEIVKMIPIHEQNKIIVIVNVDKKKYHSKLIDLNDLFNNSQLKVFLDKESIENYYEIY